jgi:hypothetical protein
VSKVGGWSSRALETGTLAVRWRLTTLSLPVMVVLRWPLKIVADRIAFQRFGASFEFWRGVGVE